MIRCFIICPNVGNKLSVGNKNSQYKLNEFISLTKALKTVSVVETISVNIITIRAGTFFGTGKLSEFISIVEKRDIQLILVNSKLSPMQQRNLERVFKAKVIDRTGLILKIFASRAQTKEGVLQVELANLEYQKSRLVRSWTHLERQRGGGGFMGGPGETQIESDRRAIAEKISKIKKLLQKVIRTRRLHRKGREKSNVPVVALVGYTNAGKSTIFNYLTSANVLAKDMLFATLDPTMRAFRLWDGKEIILLDTVGFISDLPTHLVSAFKATLEEVVSADLLLHVRDISHLDNRQQANDVNDTLDRLDWGSNERPPIIEVYNKIDKIKDSRLNELKTLQSNSQKEVILSGVTGEGIESLQTQIKRILTPGNTYEEIFLDFSDSRKRAWLFEKKIIRSEKIKNGGYLVKVAWSRKQKSQFLKF